MECEEVPILPSAKGNVSGESHLVYRISGIMWNGARGISIPAPATNPLLMYFLSFEMNGLEVVGGAELVEVLNDVLSVR